MSSDDGLKKCLCGQAGRCWHCGSPAWRSRLSPATAYLATRRMVMRRSRRCSRPGQPRNFRSVSKPMFRSDKKLDVCWGHRADVDAADPLGRTALMVAAGAALPEAVRSAQRCPRIRSPCAPKLSVCWGR